MSRIALSLSFCGTPYHGWQKQPDQPSIQEALEKALEQMTQVQTEVICAGRTDKGVHALAMVAHFDTEKAYQSHEWVFGLNHFLPKSIRIHQALEVDPSFHARFSALSRRYHYLILNSETDAPLLQERVFWHPIPLNVAWMQEAAQNLVGTHDFSSFRGKDCQAKTAIKKLHFCKISQQDKLVLIDIQADGFLHHMVRNIVGVLLKIGEGRQPVTWIKEVLEAQDRTAAAMNVPAHGLYFKEVTYPPECGLKGF